MGVRRARQRVLRQGHNKADPGILETHLAQRRDLGLDIATKDVDGQGVAYGQSDLGRFLGGKGRKRWPRVIIWPPSARHDFLGRGCGRGVGHAAIALDHPMIARHILCALAVDAGDDAPEHRCGIDAGDRGVACDAVEKGLQLVGLDIDEEVCRRDGGQIALDRRAQVAVDLPHGRQYRQAKPQRQDNACGLGPRPAHRA